MQKEKKKIILNTLADLVKEHMLKDKSPSRLAMEYGLSTSIMCLLLKGKKNLQITTFIMVAEILEVNPAELLKAVMKNLPEDFTTFDI